MAEFSAAEAFRFREVTLFGSFPIAFLFVHGGRIHLFIVGFGRAV